MRPRSAGRARTAGSVGEAPQAADRLLRRGSAPAPAAPGGHCPCPLPRWRPRLPRPSAAARGVCGSAGGAGDVARLGPSCPAATRRGPGRLRERPRQRGGSWGRPGRGRWRRGAAGPGRERAAAQRGAPPALRGSVQQPLACGARRGPERPRSPEQKGGGGGCHCRAGSGRTRGSRGSRGAAWQPCGFPPQPKRASAANTERQGSPSAAIVTESKRCDLPPPQSPGCLWALSADLFSSLHQRPEGYIFTFRD